jgi:hypothetical protein
MTTEHGIDDWGDGLTSLTQVPMPEACASWDPSESAPFTVYRRTPPQSPRRRWTPEEVVLAHTAVIAAASVAIATVMSFSMTTMFCALMFAAST